MDRALWITWYDLPEKGCDAYFAWLHEKYLPQLLARPGYLGAAHYASVEKKARPHSARESGLVRTNDPALPSGYRYILIVAADDASAFGNFVPSALHAGLADEDRKMLAMRGGERVNIAVESARVDGPAAKDYKDGMALAPCIQLGAFNCEPQAEEEMLAWYTQWRMPRMRVTSGCVRMRRLASMLGWARHMVLYEFTSLADRNEHFVKHEDRDPDMKAWSDRMVRHLVHAPGSSTLACRIWPTARA
jgi:hypothetical protein